MSEILWQGDVPLVPVEDDKLKQEIIAKGKKRDDPILKHGESGNKHVLEGDVSVVEHDGKLWVVAKRGALIHETHHTVPLEIPDGTEVSVYEFISQLVEFDPLEKRIREMQD